MNALEWIKHSRFVADERGISLVIVVVFLPVAVLLSVLAIDVANWFTHHSHLQTQADAAALAAAQDFQFPCTAGGVIDQKIATTVHQYDGTGPGAFNTQIGNPTPSSTYNSNQNNVISLINANNYVNQSEPGDSDLSGSPCTDSAVDVKVTETNLPWFFQVAHVNYINARARVSIEKQSQATGVQPIAIQNPAPSKVHVTLIDETTSPPTPLGCPDAAHPCQADLQTSDNQSWSNATTPLPAIFNDALSGSMRVGLRVTLSSGTTSTTCGDTGVACYDSGSTNGIVFIRGWSGDGTPGAVTPPATAPSPPQAQDVTLVPPTGGCADGYFVSSSTDCTVQANAVVQFASGVTCADASLTIDAGGNTYDMTSPCGVGPKTGSASGTWVSPAINVPSNSGPVDFNKLDWTLTTGKKPLGAGGGTGTDCGDGVKHGKTTDPQPCTGNFDNNGDVQRAFSGAYDLNTAVGSRSGPVIQASVTAGPTDSNPGTEVNSVRRCSATAGFVYSTCQHNLVVNVGVLGLQNSETIGSAPVELRVTNPQANGAVSCPGSSAGAGQWTTDLEQGCGVLGTTSADASTACLVAQTPPVCLSVNSGVGKDLGPGINFLINGSANANTCVKPNHWVQPNTIDQILTQNPRDPRLRQLIITDANALSNGRGTIPIRAFATFYITGWTDKGGGGNPCPTTGGNGTSSNGLSYTHDDAPAVAGSGNVLLGHFVKYNEPSGSGGGSGAPCNSINTPGDCIAVLTK